MIEPKIFYLYGASDSSKILKKKNGFGFFKFKKFKTRKKPKKGAFAKVWEEQNG